jgi:hypothetical protein
MQLVTSNKPTDQLLPRLPASFTYNAPCFLVSFPFQRQTWSVISRKPVLLSPTKSHHLSQQTRDHRPLMPYHCREYAFP